MQKLKVGLIGIGKITQIKHLHFLFESRDYEIKAVSDFSELLLKEISEKYQIDHQFDDYKEMLSLNLDAIFVLNHNHSQPIVDALKTGHHVFTEKPLCWTLPEANKIKEVVQETGKKLFIGYMKRYIPFEGDLTSDDSYKLVRMHTFAYDTKDIIPPYYLLCKDSTQKVNKQIAQDTILNLIESNLGFNKQQAINYKLLMELGIHNLNFVVDILGKPEKVEYVRFEEKTFTCFLKFPNNVNCIWEIGAFFEGKKEWDDYISFYGTNMDLTLRFPNPFIRNLPVSIEKKQMIKGAVSHSKETLFYEDAFKLELDHFARCIRDNSEPITGVDNGIKDIEIIENIVRSAE